MVSLLIVWVQAGSSGEWRSVSTWNNEDVLAWAEGLANPTFTQLVQTKVCLCWALFHMYILFVLLVYRVSSCVQGMTGSELFLADNQTLVDLGIESESTRQAVLEAVGELKATENNKLQNFYKFKV